MQQLLTSLTQQKALFMNHTPDWLSDDNIQQHSVDVRQFMGFRQATLPDGLRVIDAYNSSGLQYTILPDRGMDIWAASYNGKPLTWLSQGSPFLPDMSQGWLRQFNGGLLTTCGLTHVGPPEADPATGAHRGIHGKYTYQRAHTLNANATTLTATIAQSSLFGEQLQLVRRYTLTPGVPRIAIHDEVTNLADEPSPFMLLYHCNVGYPLVQAGTQVTVASQVYPRDEAAQAAASTWQAYQAPQPRFAEQVYFHHVRTDGATASAALMNADWGLLFEWDAAAMPYLSQWKNTRQGIFVSGIEPGNCIPEGQNAARESGRLVMLQPGETQAFTLSMTVLDGEPALKAATDAIQASAERGELVAGCDLSGYSHL